MLELVYGCVDQFLVEGDWKLMGLLILVMWDFSLEVLIFDVDNGGFSLNFIVSLDLIYFIEGEVCVKDCIDEFGIQQFVKYIVDEVCVCCQSGVWMCFYWGDYYYIGYMVLLGVSDGGGVKEIVIYSFEFKLVDGQIFQIIEVDGDILVIGVSVVLMISFIVVGFSIIFVVNIVLEDVDNKLFIVSLFVLVCVIVVIIGNMVIVLVLLGVMVGIVIIIVKMVDGEFVVIYVVIVMV